MTEVRLGDKRIPFIYQGDELIHPNPVKDGLILWYDFSAMSNSDVSKGIAKDLSGNGHDGTLQNFNYTDESGYVGDGLKFDGVDDVVIQGTLKSPNSATLSATILYYEDSSSDQRDIMTWNINVVLRVTKFGEVIFVDKRKSPDRIVSDSRFDSTLPVSVDVVVTPDDNEIYINGVFSGNLSPTDTELMTVDSALRFGSFSPSSIYDGFIFSTKIYNRPLTAEEIQHNYQLEKARFRL